MHDSVLSDFEPELVILLPGGQDTINEEISGFKVIGFDGQLLDRVPSGLITSARMERTHVLGWSDL